MPTVADAARRLAELAPPDLAAEWDNVGLLVGDADSPLERVVTCLTITPAVVEEAVERDASLVVTHHPLPFRPLKRLTTDSVEGAMLWRLAGAGIAVYSAHTAFDSAADGINEQLAAGLDLTGVAPLEASQREDGAGVGRVGDLATDTTLVDLARRAKKLLGLPSLRVVGADKQSVSRLAIVCGSGGSLFDAAVAARADAILTGEASFHDCLKCESLGVALLLTGHYASERFAMERLAETLDGELGGVEVWASTAEADPLRTV